MNDQTSHDSLFQKLTELMARSKTFSNLPPEKIQEVKDKYQKATDEQLWMGIEMLMADINKTDLEEQKSHSNYGEKKSGLQELKNQEKQEQENEIKKLSGLLNELNKEDKKDNQSLWQQIRFLIKLFFIFLLFAILIDFAFNFKEQIGSFLSIFWRP